MSNQSANHAAKITMAESTKRFLMAREACIVGAMMMEGFTRDQAEENTDEAIAELYDLIKPELEKSSGKISNLFKSVPPPRKMKSRRINRPTNQNMLSTVYH